MIKIIIILTLLVPLYIQGQTNNKVRNIYEIELKNLEFRHPVKYAKNGYKVVVDFYILKEEIFNSLSGYVVDSKDSIAIAEFKSKLSKVSDTSNDTIDFNDLPTLGKIYFSNDREIVFQSMLAIISKGSAKIQNINSEKTIEKIIIINKKKSTIINACRGGRILKIKMNNGF